MKNDRSPVVVGFDGSRQAVAAAEWAWAEARSRGVSLRLTYVYSGAGTYSAMAMYGNLPMPEAGVLKSAAETVLADAAATLARHGPEVEISTRAYDGDAVPILLGEAKHASTIVLGSRHLGAIYSAVLGSVGSAVSARAECPVVVVRKTADPTPLGSGVVVGVQGDENCEDAIGYAFDYASRRGLPLTAALCWRPDLLVNLLVRDEMAVPAGVQALLSEALAGWREKYPDVEVLEAVILDHPVDGLVFASKTDQLLVVGTHGRGALAGVVLGSVSRGVLHHATCPVAVVPSVTVS